MSFLNQVVEFAKVISSAVAGPHAAALFNVTGVGGFSFAADGGISGADTSDTGGEQAHEQEAYQALGIIARPLPPDGDLFTEALTLRTGDGLIPFAYRDLRINRAVNPGGGATTPREGQLLFAGYGGAFLSHAMTAAPTGAKRGNVTTLYCPHDFDGDGMPTRAHAITLDPSEGNSSITLVHASGFIVAITDEGITASADAATFFHLRPGEFSVSAAKISLRGNVYVGRTPEAGAQLLPGPISPPCPSLFLSPV